MKYMPTHGRLGPLRRASTRDVRGQTLRVTVAVVLAGLIALLLVTPSASAYQLIGCKWSHKHIKFYVPSPLASYGIWTAAAGLWSGLDANFVLTGSSPDMYGTNENRGNTVAWVGATRKKGTLQTPPPCPSGIYKHGKLEVVINWSKVNALGYGNPKKKMVAAHELGHAFGLAHTPQHPEWLMYPSDTGRTVKVPQPNDKAGVNAIY